MSQSKTIHAVILLIAMLLGCQSTQPVGNQYSIQVSQSKSSSIDRNSDTKVVILDNDLREKLVVNTPILYRSGRGPMRIEVPIVYLGEDKCPIEYRFKFFGFKGLLSNNDETEAEEEKSWKKGTLEAMAFTRLKGKAPDSSAQNFRLEIRKPIN